MPEESDFFMSFPTPSVALLLVPLIQEGQFSFFFNSSFWFRGGGIYAGGVWFFLCFFELPPPCGASLYVRHSLVKLKLQSSQTTLVTRCPSYPRGTVFLFFFNSSSKFRGGGIHAGGVWFFNVFSNSLRRFAPRPSYLRGTVFRFLSTCVAHFIFIPHKRCHHCDSKVTSRLRLIHDCEKRCMLYVFSVAFVRPSI